MAETQMENEPGSLARLADRLASQSRRRIPVLALGLLLILGSFGYFIVNLRQALHEESQARQLAEDGRKDAQQRANEVADTLEKARAAYSAGNFEAVGTLLKAAIKEAEQSAQAVRATGSGPASVPAPRLQPTPTPTTIAIRTAQRAHPQKVYIQFAGLIERSEIVTLNQALRQAGWNVQGASGERTGVAAGLNEVRYAGASRDAAEELAKALTETGLTGTVTTREVPIVTGNVLEIWISRT